MNVSILIGTVTVTAALMAYLIAIITEQFKRKISTVVLVFLTVGVTLDVD